jgi:hypothetical protein
MGYTIGFTYNAKVVILYVNIRNFKIINGLKKWVNQIDIISMHRQTIPLFIIIKGC